jgi:amidase
VTEAVMAAVDELAKAGAEVGKVSVPAHLAARSVGTMLGAEGSRSVFDGGFMGAFARTYYPTKLVAAIAKMNRHGTGALPPSKKLSLLTSEYSRRSFNGAVYAKAHNVRNGIIAGVDAALTEFDILVTPTCPTVAPKWVPTEANYLDALKPELDASKNQVPGVRIRNRDTRPYNYTGHPALTVPCGKSGGMPIGLQLIGRFWDDGLLLQAAYAYQESVDWETLITPKA